MEPRAVVVVEVVGEEEWEEGLELVVAFLVAKQLNLARVVGFGVSEFPWGSGCEIGLCGKRGGELRCL